MKKTGVFVCHCGINIAGTVDVKKVVSEIALHRGVAHAEEYVYMCSDPGQALIGKTIKEKNLDCVVVASCSPNLHETTFRNAVQAAGINPFNCEVANIREQCSWVHNRQKDWATLKAIKLTKIAVEKVMQNEPLTPIEFPVTRKALVIGGGIAGIQSALDLANSGHQVILVERTPSIGGHMIQLSETFPTLDCSQCILTPKMVEVSKHPNIKLMTYSEVKEVSGYVGNFQVEIRKKPTYVDPNKCTLCDECSKVCPVLAPNEFEMGLTGRRAIYIPFPQAIPATYTLDTRHCPGLVPIACGKCADVCDAGAIDYDMQEEIITEKVGAIIVATGYDLYDKEKMTEYGYGKYADVLDGLQFERLCSASGPTQGMVRRPSDHKIPKTVVFIQCVGSRDPELHCAYCSKICCMYTAKHAMLYKHAVHDGKAYIFYIDIRSAGKDYEEFVARAVEDDGVTYLRGKVSKVFEENGKIKVFGVDTLSSQALEIDADMVVMATAIRPSKDSDKLAKNLKLSINKDGFLSEAHPKLKPVESVTAGYYYAGAAQAPKDIPEAVAQASGAAAKAMTILSKDTLFHAPTVAQTNENICTGCSMCIQVCPYEAIKLDENKKAIVNEVLCEGCGTCQATCVRAAITVKNYSPRQVHEMIKQSLAGV